MWIIGQRIQHGQVLFLVTDAVAIAILDSQDAIALGQIDPAIVTKLDMHGGIGLVVEHATMLACFVEHQNFIMLWAVVTFGTKVCVASDQPDVALAIDIDTSRVISDGCSATSVMRTPA